MKNKKYLAWFFTGESLNKAFVVNSLLINQLCKNFEKIYFINMDKFILFTDACSCERKFDIEVDKNFEVPSNIEVFVPKTIKNFEDFMIGKELIAINCIKRTLSFLKINFLLARHQIKHVQLHNIGFYNTSSKLRNKSFWKSLIFKLNKYYGHKLTVLLSNFGLVSKMQIRFTSIPEIINLINKSFIKKILYNLKLYYAKELVLVNSSQFDEFKKNKIEVIEDKIVLLDYNYNHGDVVAYGGKIDKAKIEKHYYYLNKLINNFSNIYNKKVTVCLHPSDNLEFKRKYYPNLNVVQYQTKENICKAFLVLFFDSSAIVQAILLKKRILTLISNDMGENVINHSLEFIKKAGTLKINIEDTINFDKDKFLSKLDSAKENYPNYIKSYVAPDGDNVSYEKIIKILKERFFKDT
jgi:hypothetical protein|tara:strand:+ start:279 stop:1508 length:1230 start_codon:yes stop_codon:yes gene_type:complete